MNKKLILIITVLGVLFFNQISLAQENYQRSLTIPERDIYKFLNIKEPSLLPTSPFYFLKEWGRGIRLFFTFDPIKKADLELKFNDEKLAEALKVVEKNCSIEQKQNCNQKALEKALNNYFKSQEKLTKRLEGLENNPNVQSLISKVMEKIILHQVVLDELNARVITPSGKVIVKNIQKNRRLVSNNEKHIIAGVEAALSKLSYEEGVKELKALEVLTRIEENLPEEAKKGIEIAKENIEKKLIEEGKIQGVENWQDIQSSEGLYTINGVPVEKQTIEKVIEKLEKKAKEVNSISQRPNIVNIQAIEKLKTKLEEATISTSATKTEPIPSKILPVSTYTEPTEPQTPSRKTSTVTSSEPVKPEIPLKTATRTESTPIEEQSRKEPIFCIQQYDPVCGVDGKSYSNECMAKVAGVEIKYKGECEKSEPLQY